MPQNLDTSKKLQSVKSVVDTSPPIGYYEKLQGARQSRPPSRAEKRREPSLSDRSYDKNRTTIVKHDCINCCKEENPPTRSQSLPPRPPTRRKPADMPAPRQLSTRARSSGPSSRKSSAQKSRSARSQHSSKSTPPVFAHFTASIQPHSSRQADNIKVNEKSPTGPTPAPRNAKCKQRDTSYKNSISDHEYLQFSLRITEDIIRNDLYSNKEMRRVFNSHLEANRGRLDMEKMTQQIDNLCKELNIPLNDTQDDDPMTRSQIKVKRNNLSCICAPRVRHIELKDCECGSARCLPFRCVQHSVSNIETENKTTTYSTSINTTPSSQGTVKDKTEEEGTEEYTSTFEMHQDDVSEHEIYDNPISIPVTPMCLSTQFLAETDDEIMYDTIPYYSETDSSSHVRHSLGFLQLPLLPSLSRVTEKTEPTTSSETVDAKLETSERNAESSSEFDATDVLPVFEHLEYEQTKLDTHSMSESMQSKKSIRFGNHRMKMLHSSNSQMEVAQEYLIALQPEDSKSSKLGLSCTKPEATTSVQQVPTAASSSSVFWVICPYKNTEQSITSKHGFIHGDEKKSNKERIIASTSVNLAPISESFMKTCPPIYYTQPVEEKPSNERTITSVKSTPISEFYMETSCYGPLTHHPPSIEEELNSERTIASTSVKSMPRSELHNKTTSSAPSQSTCKSIPSTQQTIPEVRSELMKYVKVPIPTPRSYINDGHNTSRQSIEVYLPFVNETITKSSNDTCRTCLNQIPCNCNKKKTSKDQILQPETSNIKIRGPNNCEEEFILVPGPIYVPKSSIIPMKTETSSRHIPAHAVETVKKDIQSFSKDAMVSTDEQVPVKFTAGNVQQTNSSMSPKFNVIKEPSNGSNTSSCQGSCMGSMKSNQSVLSNPVVRESESNLLTYSQLHSSAEQAMHVTSFTSNISTISNMPPQTVPISESILMQDKVQKNIIKPPKIFKYKDSYPASPTYSVQSNALIHLNDYDLTPQRDSNKSVYNGNTIQNTESQQSYKDKFILFNKDALLLGDEYEIKNDFASKKSSLSSCFDNGLPPTICKFYPNTSTQTYSADFLLPKTTSINSSKKLDSDLNSINFDADLHSIKNFNADLKQEKVSNSDIESFKINYSDFESFKHIYQQQSEMETVKELYQQNVETEAVDDEPETELRKQSILKKKYISGSNHERAKQQETEISEPYKLEIPYLELLSLQDEESVNSEQQFDSVGLNKSVSYSHNQKRNSDSISQILQMPDEIDIFENEPEDNDNQNTDVDQEEFTMEDNEKAEENEIFLHSVESDTNEDEVVEDETNEDEINEEEKNKGVTNEDETNEGDTNDDETNESETNEENDNYEAVDILEELDDADPIDPINSEAHRASIMQTISLVTTNLERYRNTEIPVDEYVQSHYNIPTQNRTLTVADDLIQQQAESIAKKVSATSTISNASNASSYIGSKSKLPFIEVISSETNMDVKRETSSEFETILCCGIKKIKSKGRRDIVTVDPSSTQMPNISIIPDDQLFEMQPRRPTVDSGYGNGRKSLRFDYSAMEQFSENLRNPTLDIKDFTSSYSTSQSVANVTGVVSSEVIPAARNPVVSYDTSLPLQQSKGEDIDSNVSAVQFNDNITTIQRNSVVDILPPQQNSSLCSVRVLDTPDSEKRSAKGSR